MALDGSMCLELVWQFTLVLQKREGTGMFKIKPRTLGVWFAFTLIGVLIGACGRFVVGVVVTSTPDPNVIVITVTPNSSTAEVAPTAEPVSTEAVTGGALEVATESATDSADVPTATLSAFPTETRAELYVAQQDFERGYMFWIQPRDQIWVLVQGDNPNGNSGTWYVYEDIYMEGEPEDDPNIQVPENMFQPRRGFGKLWRETPGLRDTLGFAITPEFDLTTQYTYQPGGSLDATGQYIPGPGKHFITALSRDVFIISESADGPGTWERLDN
jgi:hypothetical protein